MKIEWTDHRLQEIIDYWMKGYRFKKGEYLYKYEYFVDQNKGVVALKLYLTEDKNATPGG